MNFFEKVKNIITDLGHAIIEEHAEEGILVISNEDHGIHNMVLDCEDNLLVIEQKMLEVAVDSPELFKQVLQANRRLVFGAYVLDETGKFLIFRDTLELDNLDANELEASLNALPLALVETMDLLLALSGEAENV